ncbi:response regulator transcription factor [Cohnella zeiphila]|uniref:Response regulator n=1 Tax=Cohnella zeiphila TaxID=2761120 RepID=A0A7X0VTE9_9BACL|nr:helix-turn-helix domain-containing protein [Cohnella zeiphila]MBB6729861.1 response regulator [Cohnella zeiphila]
MNALVVDDDFYVVTALEKKIDWESLRIETVYTAHNVAQAREILRNHPVHILISDIEMPQGSGLELLAWIREERYDVQAILLTNYADFNYAQKAIELQSFEYFLKPIEFDKLMLIIQKAVARANEQMNREQAVQEGYYWKRSRAKRLEHFWRGLIGSCASSPPKPAAVARSAEEEQLSYRLDDQFQTLLLNVFPRDGSMGKEEKSLFDFAFLNVFGELFRHPGFSVETVLEHKDDNRIAVLRWNGPPDDGRPLTALCASFIEKANRFLKCDVICNIAPPERLESIGRGVKRLLDLDEDWVRCRNRTFRTEQFRLEAPAGYAPPDLSRLEELLNGNRPAAFLEETIRFLRDRSGDGALNKTVLGLFRLDIVQLVYSFLKSKGIQAHRLYTGRTNDTLLARSLDSVEDMEQYLSCLANTAMEYQVFAERPQSVVEQIKRHIHAHCGDPLTRNSLAEIVYLHPDYLARLFKKETGVSIGNYVIQARIEAAKRLLATTRLSVYAVASKVGYANYSYFSKLFKHDVGLSPNEYKRQAGT